MLIKFGSNVDSQQMRGFVWFDMQMKAYVAP